MDPRVLTVILGGGRGARLYPLTRLRAKPAVPLGGKYRLIDVPISNSINSGYKRIFVLTQFNSASLNQHVMRTFRFDAFTDGFVQVLAAEQGETSEDWYQGTADAVRKQLHRIDRANFDLVLVLAGDHLYRMDYRKLVARHLESGADVTVASIGVDRRGCEGFGIFSVDGEGRIVRFQEKPRADEDISDLMVPAGLAHRWNLGDRRYLASMGVYVFSRTALRKALDLPGAIDFGRDILPAMAETNRVMVHLFDGYWEDIGTIEAFYRANLALCQPRPPFRFGDPAGVIYTRARFLPATRFGDARLVNSIISDGCIIDGSELRTSVVGLRSRVRPGAKLDGVVLMGSDLYEEDHVRAENARAGIPDVGVGEGAVLVRAIIDKNARIGAGAVLRGDPDRPDADGPGWAVRDGIVIVEKNATIPPGTVI